MRFVRDDGANLRAEKLSGGGALYYSSWSDESGDKYVRVEENVGGGPTNGSFSSNLYRLDDVGNKSDPLGFMIETGEQVTSKDNNMSAFLRAIAKDVERRKQND